MKLTATQRASLDALVPRRRAFVLEWLSNGLNGKQAAIAVGYAEDSAEVTASQLLSDPKVAAAVEVMRAPVEERKYRDAEALKEWWDAKMDSAAEDKDQLKASEYLGRSQGVFEDRLRVDMTGVPKDRAELRARLEEMVDAEEGDIVWRTPLPPGSEST